MKIDYRLALDLGTNSIGWCIYRLAIDEGSTDERERWRPIRIQRMGARIFSDGRNPKDLASLAMARRVARQQRRRRDRALRRKGKLLDALIELGLLPQDSVQRKALVALDPYVLRAQALTVPLNPHHVGRALFHLARKRGFRSGRKDLTSEDKETGKVKTGIANLKARLAEAGCATVGAYLAQRHAHREPVLARPDASGEYAIYLARELVAEEFDAIWASQHPHNPNVFTAAAAARIRDIILYQRPLRPVEPGKCFFEPDEFRALLAHPQSQRFRILQELANLRIEYAKFDVRSLARDQRNMLLDLLTHGGSSLKDGGRVLTWAELRKLIRAPKGAPINLDTSGRKGLKADSVSIRLSDPTAVGPAWRDCGTAHQDRFLHVLRRIDRLDDLDVALRGQGFDVPVERLAAIFQVAARMEDEFGAVSLKALSKIVPQLESEVIHYDEAVRRGGYRSHSDRYEGLLEPNLPYYGQCLPGYVQPRALPTASPEERQYGRIPNPTVHVGLNQLRRIVNAIIKRYGHPKEIIVEVARELGMSGERRRELIREQEQNRHRGERHADELARLGLKNNRENRQRLQLFEEIAANDPLGAECIYSGERISQARLFSDEIEIDHILPFSRSLDDGIGNKLLCVRRANRDKKQQTPHEAFGASPGRYGWPDILARVERLVPRKARRFSEDAMEAFLRDRDFLDRHLTDTAYFSRVARDYLTAICPPNRIWVSTGKLTAMVRAKLGLNRILSSTGNKERNDHRHHAVDAAVIGICDRRVIRAVATAAARAESNGEWRLVQGIDPPWPGFFEDVRATVDRVIVSHKPEHGLDGGLHNETSYGLVEGPDQKGRSLVAHRIVVTDLKSRADAEKMLDDGPLKQQLVELLSANSGTALKQALAEFIRKSGVKRVRVAERLSVQEIQNPNRAAPKLVKPDGNYCYLVQRKESSGWGGSAVTRLTATRVARPTGGTFPPPASTVMLVRVGDSIAAEKEPGRIGIFRVVKLSGAQLALAPHHEAGALKARDSDPADPFKYWYVSATSLHGAKARVVGVDELGYVNDPGFRE